MSDVEMFRKLFARLDSNHQGEREAALNLLYEHLRKRGKSFLDVLNALDDTVPKATHEELLKKFQEAAQRSAEWRRAYDELQRRQAGAASAGGTTSSRSQPQQQAARPPSTKWGAWLVVALFVGVPILATLGTNSPPRPTSPPAVSSPRIAKPVSPATTSSTATAVSAPPVTVAAAPSPPPTPTPEPVQPYFSTPPPPLPVPLPAPVATAPTPAAAPPTPLLPPAASPTPLLPPQLFSSPPATKPVAAIDRRLVRSRDELIHYLHDANAFDAVLLDPTQRDIVLANLIDVYDGDPAAIAQHLKSWRDYPEDAPGSAINTEFVFESVADQARFDHTMTWLIWSYHGDWAEIATTLQKLRDSHVHHAS